MPLADDSAVKVVPCLPALVAGLAIAVPAGIARSEVDPAVKCGVAYSKLQASFASSAAKLAPVLCKDPGEFSSQAAALAAKTNAKIASFNAAYSDLGCDADIEFPVPTKDTAQVMLVLQNEFGAVPLDKFCNALPDSADALCGNGEEDPGEACDLTDLGGQSCESLGNGEGTLACQGDCQAFDLSGCSGTPICGNGVEESGEDCDDQNSNNTDACLKSCQTAICGDGVTRAGFEQCDDGNQVQTDACTNSCQVAFCGDGFARAGVEQCDDQNSSNTDACLNSCENSRCGDGFIRAGVEQCDDGGTASGDGCSSICTIE